jgi:predicted nucleotidyltransferase
MYSGGRKFRFVIIGTTSVMFMHVRSTTMYSDGRKFRFVIIGTTSVMFVHVRSTTVTRSEMYSYSNSLIRISTIATLRWTGEAMYV